MAQATKAVNRHDVTRSSPAISQRVERRNAGTHQRRSSDRRKVVGNHCNCTNRGNHISPIPAVERDSGRLHELTGEDISAAALVALTAISAEPADADALANFQMR